MAIAAKRFDFLSRETNVPVMDFVAEKTDGVFNTVLNLPIELNGELDALFSATSQVENLSSIINSSVSDALGDAANTAKDALQSSSLVSSAKSLIADSGLSELKNLGNISGLSSIIRETKTGLGQVMDLTKMSKDGFTSYLNTSLGGNNLGAAKSMFDVASRCSARGLGYGLPGAPWNPSINCGGGKLNVGNRGMGNSCSTGSYSNLLNKLTGGAYSSGFSDLTSLARSLMSLSGFGYNLGLCGVLSSLTSQFNPPTDVLGRVAGGLLGMTATAGNVNGVLDIANLRNIRPFDFESTAPNVLSTFVNNFKTPANVTEAGLLGLGERVFAGLGALDADWNRSSLGNDELSCSIADADNDDFRMTLSSLLGDRSFGEDDLDAVPDSDDLFFGAAYLTKDWSDDTSFI